MAFDGTTYRSVDAAGLTSGEPGSALLDAALGNQARHLLRVDGTNLSAPLDARSSTTDAPPADETEICTPRWATAYLVDLWLEPGTRQIDLKAWAKIDRDADAVSAEMGVRLELMGFGVKETKWGGDWQIQEVSLDLGAPLDFLGWATLALHVISRPSAVQVGAPVMGYTEGRKLIESTSVLPSDLSRVLVTASDPVLEDVVWDYERAEITYHRGDPVAAFDATWQYLSYLYMRAVRVQVTRQELRYP